MNNTLNPLIKKRIRKELLKIIYNSKPYTKEIQSERVHISGYITNVLNSSNSLYDYLELIPKVIHKPINQILFLLQESENKKPTLSEKEIDEILNRHEDTIILLKKRLMINLIT